MILLWNVMEVTTMFVFHVVLGNIVEMIVVNKFG